MTWASLIIQVTKCDSVCVCACESEREREREWEREKERERDGTRSYLYVYDVCWSTFENITEQVVFLIIGQGVFFITGQVVLFLNAFLGHANILITITISFKHHSHPYGSASKWHCPSFGKFTFFIQRTKASLLPFGLTSSATPSKTSTSFELRMPTKLQWWLKYRTEFVKRTATFFTTLPFSMRVSSSTWGWSTDSIVIWNYTIRIQNIEFMQIHQLWYIFLR